jgi:hypothetical protein
MLMGTSFLPCKLRQGPASSQVIIGICIPFKVENYYFSLITVFLVLSLRRELSLNSPLLSWRDSYNPIPVSFSGFLTESYNTGGLISVMALGSLFILITKYGLEYPDFYNKLYALLEPSIFVARYRSRFFEVSCCAFLRWWYMNIFMLQIRSGQANVVVRLVENWF